jgi:hypothetical protein
LEFCTVEENGEGEKRGLGEKTKKSKIQSQVSDKVEAEYGKCFWAGQVTGYINFLINYLVLAVLLLIHFFTFHSSPKYLLGM